MIIALGAMLPKPSEVPSDNPIKGILQEGKVQAWQL